MENEYSNSNDSAEQVFVMLSYIHDFISNTSQLINGYNSKPSVGSIAVQEINTFQRKESVNNAHYGGFFSMEIAADHLMAFVDLLKEPAKSIAPWTCVRGLLESCALASWFLEPTIDVKTRVGRYFAFRYSGFVQQSKLYNSKNSSSSIERLNQRIHQVEQDAISLGYSPIINKTGKIDGIGQKMPTITELIDITLKREMEYRLLSAVSHGHHWAIHQISFRRIDDSTTDIETQVLLEKFIKPTYVLYIANIAVTSFAQVLWYIWQLYGWNEGEIKDHLEITFNRLSYSDEHRFWRK